MTYRWFGALVEKRRKKIKKIRTLRDALAWRTNAAGVGPRGGRGETTTVGVRRSRRENRRAAPVDGTREPTREVFSAKKKFHYTFATGPASATLVRLAVTSARARVTRRDVRVVVRSSEFAVTTVWFTGFGARRNTKEIKPRDTSQTVAYEAKKYRSKRRKRIFSYSVAPFLFRSLINRARIFM